MGTLKYSSIYLKIFNMIDIDEANKEANSRKHYQLPSGSGVSLQTQEHQDGVVKEHSFGMLSPQNLSVLDLAQKS